MSLFSLLTLASLFVVQRQIRNRSFHRKELQTFDALYRIGRWFTLVSIVWVIVAYLVERIPWSGIFDAMLSVSQSNTPYH